MFVLGIDCATAACSAALLRGEDVLARRYAEMARGHAEVLVPMIAEVLAAGNCRALDLDIIAATVGPGAFTGVRIGLSTAQAMSLASGTPVAAVTTLEAVARAQEPRQRPLMVALETKRADIYVQCFSALCDPLGAPRAVSAGELPAMAPEEPFVLAGDAAVRAAETLAAAPCEFLMSDGPSYPDAVWVGRIGVEKAPTAPGVPVTPLYLRPPDVGPPRRKRP